MAVDLTTVATAAVLGGAVKVAVGLSMPVGAGVAVAAIDAAVILTAVASPFAFGKTAQQYLDIQLGVVAAGQQMVSPLNQFQEYWEGPAAVALDEFWTETLAPVLEQLGPLAQQLATVMENVGAAEATLIKSLLGATIAMCIGMAAAWAVPPAAPGIIWPAVVAWGTFVVAVVGMLIEFLSTMGRQSSGINRQAGFLASALYTNPIQRTGNVLTPPPAAIPTLQGEVDALANYTKKA
ncbi:hypothetical protein [Aestuariimicrobium ganziense]|uniref:hypothetical protein n=1 Tax=Aestuariimicrobium ganziense TaxID=2773677 RepID=UPI001942B3DA|nr:hypothetical protein [Aestuariimicrobium ganziense]